MKILLLDADLRFINPTRSLWPRVLESIGETWIFGPGYVSRDTLSVGVEQFAAQHGPFDVIVSTEHIALASPALFSQGQYRRNFVTACRPSDLSWCPFIANAAVGLPGLHVASLMETDYQYLTAAQTACLDRFDLVVGLGQQFIRRLPELGAEAQHFVSPVTDAWWTFVQTHPVVSLPLFVSDADASATALTMRPSDWAVPGARYVQREAMWRRLTADDAWSNPYRQWKLRRRPMPWGGLLSRLGLRPWTWPWFVAQYQARFAHDLRSSKYVYTCGSVLRYPVRKFFEIPAAGALLVCQPCHGFQALGFRTGSNCLAGDDHDDLVRRVTLLPPARLQAMARQGRDLVLTQHTLQARAKQLGRVLTMALSGRYHSCRWVDGRFLVATPETVDVDDIFVNGLRYRTFSESGDTDAR